MGDVSPPKNRLRVARCARSRDALAHDGGERDGLGYVEIAECEWRGNTAYAEMSASVSNYTGKGLIATMVFRFEVIRLDKQVDNVLDDEVKLVRPQVNNGEYACDYFELIASKG